MILKSYVCTLENVVMNFIIIQIYFLLLNNLAYGGKENEKDLVFYISFYSNFLIVID